MITSFTSTLDKPDDVSLDAQLALGTVLVALSVYAVVAHDVLTTVIVASSVVAFFWSIAAHFKSLEWSLYAALILTSIWSIMQHIAGIPPLAWTGNINFIGYLGAIMAIMLVSKRSKVWWPGIVIAVVAMVIAASVGAILCATVAVAYRYRRNWRVVVVMALISLCVLVVNGSFSYLSRLEVWLAALVGTSDLPYDAQHTHNVLIQSIYSLGVLPTIAVAVPASIFAWLLARSGTAAICALCWIAVSSSVDYLYWWPGVAALVVMYLVWSIKVQVYHA